VAKKKRTMRPRSTLRADARKHESLIADREKLRLLEPGGSSARPLEVSSASVVETRAEAERCFRCDLPLRCDEHVTEASAHGLLRVAKLRCTRCGTPRTLYMRIVDNHLN
jgi:hypothetical protein